MSAPGPSTSSHRLVDAPVGVGLGLRWEMFDELFALFEGPDDEAGLLAKIPFFEVSPENYMRRGGYIPESLERVAERFSLITHGLAMNLGGTAPHEDNYFAELRRFIRRFESPWHSDHLCFGGADGKALHDLLPLPHTRASVEHCALRVKQARDRLGLPFAIENISYYAHLGAAEMSEVQFYSEVAEAADCGLLLDVNNVYVNSLNHGFDPRTWLADVDMSRVVQLHVAGHEHRPADELYIDTHGADVCAPVMELLSEVVARTGPVAVVLERDNDVPPLPQLMAERDELQAAYDRGLAQFSARQSNVAAAAGHESQSNQRQHLGTPEPRR